MSKIGLPIIYFIQLYFTPSLGSQNPVHFNHPQFLGGGFSMLEIVTNSTKLSTRTHLVLHQSVPTIHWEIYFHDFWTRDSFLACLSGSLGYNIDQLSIWVFNLATNTGDETSKDSLETRQFLKVSDRGDQLAT